MHCHTWPEDSFLTQHYAVSSEPNGWSAVPTKGRAYAHARLLVGALRARLGRRPLLSRRARAVSSSWSAPFAGSPAPAPRCRRLGGGGTRRARVTFALPSSWAPPLCACAGESRGSRVAESGAIAPVSRGSVLLPAHLLPPSPGGGAVESAPRFPRWGRSGDGSSGITEPERERPRGSVHRGGHGRRATHSLRRGSLVLRASRVPGRPLPPAPLPSGIPAPSPGSRGWWVSALCSPLYLLQILGANSVSTLWCTAPTLSYHPSLYFGVRYSLRGI
ncbi:potassium/sodium hyperpolarization-activated cyclic nucleotide-gated channel 4-like [Fukomys damarensis]|uniref:potassium/sodium hyperpolarization-activated cyclic nucleotide-gated channel 4-like n=1 Tax=Fukomys damarensis TaxID=885580 RepID=UPI001455BECE|nr:potassium/sodium hyperpolarization-activated cyclic nucleotide-gated channel 4-like [Fukomys damarensis]